MPGIHRLTQRDIDAAKPGKRLSDGGGLFLHIRDKGAKYWAVQVTIKAAYGRGQRVELGLGKHPDVNLTIARKEAQKARELARDGIDPREERRKRLEKGDTFAEICQQTFEARKAELKDDGKAGGWMSPLRIHVLPKLGSTPVQRVHQNDIVDVLKPLWHAKADTARKAMNRIGLVLKHAAAMDLEVDLQVTEKAKALLGKSRHVPMNIPAMAWQELPEFYDSLNEDIIAELALSLTILTGARSKPIRFAHADQIAGNVWIIPAQNMKGKKGLTSDFRVPLSTEAMRIVAVAMKGTRDGFLFPSPRRGVISDMAMNERMKRRGLKERPHGFRTSLRTWLSEASGAPYEVAETCISHSVGNDVTRAYNRTDYLEQRAVLMERWADFVTSGTGAAVKLTEVD